MKLRWTGLKISVLQNRLMESYNDSESFRKSVLEIARGKNLVSSEKLIPGFLLVIPSITPFSVSVSTFHSSCSSGLFTPLYTPLYMPALALPESRIVTWLQPYLESAPNPGEGASSTSSEFCWSRCWEMWLTSPRKIKVASSASGVHDQIGLSKAD